MSFSVTTFLISGDPVFGFLFGSKKTVLTPPAGVPTSNSGVRGAPIAVSFGTVRVDAQVTWTNDFRAVRQKTSTGGIFG